MAELHWRGAGAEQDARPLLQTLKGIEVDAHAPRTWTLRRGARCLIALVACVVAVVTVGVLLRRPEEVDTADRSFPEECRVLPSSFPWGVATASYQVEGAVKEGGRSPSIWDVFSHTEGKVRDGDTGDVACDQYHRVKEDVALMTAMGAKFYRFSISWNRILPAVSSGSPPPPPNPEGVAYYSGLIDTLLDAGITPMVTLFHWDLPAGLEDPSNSSAGWMDPRVVGHFEHYAEVCFREFGSRVKAWLTFNEPWVFCKMGYENGVHAPGKVGLNPYLCGHHVLLAHAAAAQLYRQQYKEQQGGRLGITLNSGWSEPWTHLASDIAAAERAQLFELGWFADPLAFGDYPPVMRARLGPRLPTFTPAQSSALRGSSDFFGLNHYTTAYVSNNPLPIAGDDIGAIPHHRDVWGKPIGPRGESAWLYVVPWGFRKLLTWIHLRYDGPEIWVTENGCSVPRESDLPMQAALQDSFRVGYYRAYLREMCRAVSEGGVRLGGYTAWSLLDNFEWADGYYVRFGLHYVDFKGTLARYPKASARWISQFFGNVTSTSRAAREPLD